MRGCVRVVRAPHCQDMSPWSAGLGGCGGPALGKTRRQADYHDGGGVGVGKEVGVGVGVGEELGVGVGE